MLQEKLVAATVRVVALRTGWGRVRAQRGVVLSPIQDIIRVVTIQTKCIDIFQQHSGKGGNVMMVAHQARIVGHRAVDEFPVTRRIGVATYAQTLLGLLNKSPAVHIVAVRAAVVAVGRMPIEPRLH